MEELSDRILRNLNNEQKEAVCTTEGYVRVVAGAGSGKTKVLTSRYIYLAKVFGIAVDHILSVTFTNKAAREMKSRIQQFMKDEDSSWICTFHSACHKILREDITHLSYPSNFIILDDDDQKILLEKIYSENGYTVKDFTYNECLKEINYYKTHFEYVPFLTDPKNEIQPQGLENSKRNEVWFIVKQYLIEQRKNYYLDFDDLMSFTLYLLNTKEDIRAKWQKHFEYIQVDEFQDVNSRQYKLVRILSGKHNNLFIVGDPDQTIYSWRGARVEFFLNFDKDFTNVKTILLTKNYRSSPEILNVSNSLIKHNQERIEKELSPIRQSGATPHYFHAKTIRDEGNWIADKILKLQESGVKLNDIAILYRANTYSRNVEEALMRKHISYVLYSGYKFYQRWEIKTALSYLKMVVWGDDLSFERIYNTPTRGIGKKKKQQIDEFAKINGISQYEALKLLQKTADFGKAKELIEVIETAKCKAIKLNPADILDYLLKTSGFEEFLMLDGNEERLENINDLKNSIKEYVDTAGEAVTLTEYLNDLSLLTDTDKAEKQDTVKMMTVHTAKGLEFGYVFVCGLNERVFPSAKVKTLQEMEEERRIAYVAYTRAEKCLFLSDASGYSSNAVQLVPSRFIFNIEPAFIEQSGELESEFAQQAQDYIEESEYELKHPTSTLSNSGLKSGDTVLHKEFGKGVIIHIDGLGYQIKFGKKERTIANNSTMVCDYRNNPQKVYNFVIQKLQRLGINLYKVSSENMTYRFENETIVLVFLNKTDYDNLIQNLLLMSTIDNFANFYNIDIKIVCGDNDSKEA